jgi:hypothetical protein
MRALVLLGVAALLPWASHAAEPASQTAVPAVAEAKADAKAPENVRTVMLDANERRPVCRRHVPTGSRIAEQRCESATREPTAADRANRDILRRDLEAMRDLQVMREQARHAAMAEALRRRGQ